MIWKKLVLSLVVSAAVAATACSSSNQGFGDGGGGGINCGAGSTVCGDSCTVIARDPQNCGACGKACATGEVCSAGACASACGSGTTKCGNECVDTKTDDRNCGMCGTKCSAGEVCNAGACAGSCTNGTTKCGNSCVDTKNDRTNCGGCGTTCKAGEICSNGTCALTCQQGLSKCTGNPDAGVSDGGVSGDYCANLASDNANCGQCGNACPQGQVCSNGACALSCQQGLTKCAANPDAGVSDGGINGDYCANLASDNANCGQCGKACGQGLVCSNGTCGVGCKSPLITCNNNSSCVDPRFDPDNCNGCGLACANITNGTRTCVNGTCGGLCGASLSLCSNACVNLLTDNANCGLCGKVCSAQATCTSGVCVGPLFTSLTGAQGSTSRGAGDACGTQLSVSSNVIVNAIAVSNAMNANGNIKFMIWTHPGHVLVYVSPPKAFAAGGQAWRKSDAIGFQLQAGQSYDIGGISDVAATWYFDTSPENTPPFASTSTNPNWTNYAAPAMGGHAAADCGIQIF